MCGIIGVINSKNFDIIDGMLQVQQHRGPDNSAKVLFPEINSAFGHNRLTIIDTSSSANQPFFDEKKEFCLVFNGEIYNYQAIKKDLILLGYSFRTSSDTEVVLNSYLAWGSKCVEYFRGMFAFAILELSTGKLFFARDRFGIKPFLYTFDNEAFIFASELKTITAYPCKEQKIRNESLMEFLMYGSIHQPNTLYEEVKQLLPGHHGTFLKGKFDTVQYWDIYNETVKLRADLADISYQDAVAELKLKLTDAAKHHVIADVPVGSFLSGGIDSTAVTGFMGTVVPDNVKTFTISFGKDFAHLDELVFAELASSYLHTTNESLQLGYAEFSVDIDQILKSMDQPSVDGTNTYYASKLASKKVRVVLSGLGGDELFAGYRHFQKISAIKRNKSSVFLPIVEKLNLKRISGRLEQWAKRGLTDRLDAMCLVRQYMSFEEAKQFLKGYNIEYEGKPFRKQHLSAYLREDLDAISQISYYEIKTYLTDTLLRDADVMGMNFGIELRPILLDHVLAEYIFALPAKFKFDGVMHKKIFIDASRQFLPNEVINRPKVGFELPIWQWAKKIQADPKKTWQHLILDKYLESKA